MPHLRFLFPCRCLHTLGPPLTTPRFVLNGLRHANRVLGETVFVERDWRVIGEYVFDGEGGRHQAFYAPLCDTVVMGDLIRPHDRIQVEQSLKYSRTEADKLWKLAGMTETSLWSHHGDYGECIHNRSCLRLCCAARSCPLRRIKYPGRLPLAFPDTWDQSDEVLNFVKPTSSSLCNNTRYLAVGPHLLMIVPACGAGLPTRFGLLLICRSLSVLD